MKLIVYAFLLKMHHSRGDLGYKSICKGTGWVWIHILFVSCYLALYPQTSSGVLSRAYIGPFKAEMVNIHCAIFLYTDEMKEFKVRCVFKILSRKCVYKVLRNYVNFAALGHFHAVSYFQEKCYICFLCNSASHNNCNFIDLNKNKC